MTAIIAFAVAVGLLIWGLNIDGADAMGYSLIALYAVLPLTSLIACAVMSASKFKGTVPAAMVLTATAFLIPLAVFKNSDWISIFFGLIPCVIGIAIGTAVKLNREK